MTADRSLHYQNGKWHRYTALEVKQPPTEDTSFIDQIRGIIKELKR